MIDDTNLQSNELALSAVAPVPRDFLFYRKQRKTSAAGGFALLTYYPGEKNQ